MPPLWAAYSAFGARVHWFVNYVVRELIDDMIEQESIVRSEIATACVPPWEHLVARFGEMDRAVVDVRGTPQI
jgi:hypothetical protein